MLGCLKHDWKYASTVNLLHALPKSLFFCVSNNQKMRLKDENSTWCWWNNNIIEKLHGHTFEFDTQNSLSLTYTHTKIEILVHRAWAEHKNKYGINRRIGAIAMEMRKKEEEKKTTAPGRRVQESETTTKIKVLLYICETIWSVKEYLWALSRCHWLLLSAYNPFSPVFSSSYSSSSNFFSLFLSFSLSDLCVRVYVLFVISFGFRFVFGDFFFFCTLSLFPARVHGDVFV